LPAWKGARSVLMKRPQVASTLAAALAPVARRNISAARLRQGALAARGGREGIYAATMTLFWPDLLASVLSPEVRESLSANAFTNHETVSAMDHGGAREPIDRYMASDIQTYLPGDLLVKVDRTTMAHGLEARSPFLDAALMEWAAHLSPEVKYAGGQLKALTKALL